MNDFSPRFTRLGTRLAALCGAATILATSAAVLAPAAHATTSNVVAPAATGAAAVPNVLTVNQRIVSEARLHVGQPYAAGAAGPSRFDCSGLVMYVYHKEGVLRVPRTADQQYRASYHIPMSHARPGDLVFNHTSSGYVYHVAIYTTTLNHWTIVAANSRQGVIHERIWDSRATFGSYTHH